MAECLGLGCYFYDLGNHFTGEQHSEVFTSVRAEHRAVSAALRGAGIKPSSCPFNTIVTVGDMSDRTILSSRSVIKEPLMSEALSMSPIEEGVVNAS